MILFFIHSCSACNQPKTRYKKIRIKKDELIQLLAQSNEIIYLYLPIFYSLHDWKTFDRQTIKERLEEKYDFENKHTLLAKNIAQLFEQSNTMAKVINPANGFTQPLHAKTIALYMQKSTQTISFKLDNTTSLSLPINELGDFLLSEEKTKITMIEKPQATQSKPSAHKQKKISASV